MFGTDGKGRLWAGKTGDLRLTDGNGVVGFLESHPGERAAVRCIALEKRGYIDPVVGPSQISICNPPVEATPHALGSER